MSAQATSALLNGTPQGSGIQSAGYGSADADLVERPVLSRTENLESVEQSERAAAPPTTADVNGPEAPSSSNHLEGAGSATTGVPPASSGRPVTEDGFPELRSGMQSSAQRAEIATGLVDAVTSAGLPDVGVDPGDLGVNRGYFTPRSRTSQFGGPAKPPSQLARRPAGDPLGRAPGQSGLGDPWTAIWEGISGKFGSRAKTSASGGATSLAPAAPKTPAPATDVPATPVLQPPTGSSNEILEALTEGMQQLQDLQMKAMKKDTDNGDSPEVVKTATVNLPELRPPLGETCGLVLQDWLVQVTTAMQDLSATSGDWWEQVREKVAETYSLWLEATPLERLQVMPADHPKLSSGRWMRVNARACALMMQSFAEVVKADLIARRSTQSAVMVLFRLYTTYQPGGAAERAVVLRHLQGSDPPADVAACLDALRSWPRWLQRCKDMNMTVPDGSILACPEFDKHSQ
eukprot:s2277_g6.t1